MISQVESSGDGAGSGSDLVLLFHAQERPSIAEVVSVVASLNGVSVVGEAVGNEQASKRLELHIDGMTFDLVGLDPAPRIAVPEIRDWRDIAVEVRGAPLVGVGLAAGPHIEAGKASTPVVRGALRLARLLGDAFAGCAGVCWVPSGVAQSKPAFVDAVDRWLGGGPMPTTFVVTLAAAIDGAIESRGLAWFTGQEVRIEPIVADDREQAKLLAYRLVEQLIHRGTLEAPEQSTAPDGRVLRLEPSANRRYVRVWLA
ncbi:hypothetical protein ELI_05440 [Erythrobacter litoralis HTCC2594]|uniref:DUF4261 domain-containing protein n=1 Tax=Erythrobacter litoralis (strain HTCC2594) TaxID=314225 RepID=Q2NAW1_ERYLH|nr:hypothetical protein ELI_05440 [Erythrobacter litoralis HTCC2594]